MHKCRRMAVGYAELHDVQEDWLRRWAVWPGYAIMAAADAGLKQQAKNVKRRSCVWPNASLSLNQRCQKPAAGKALRSAACSSPGRSTDTIPLSTGPTLGRPWTGPTAAARAPPAVGYRLGGSVAAVRMGSWVGGWDKGLHAVVLHNPGLKSGRASTAGPEGHVRVLATDPCMLGACAQSTGPGHNASCLIHGRMSVTPGGT